MRPMQADDRFFDFLHDQLKSPLLVELADCVNDFVLVLDGELRIAMSNRHATALFGYSEKELATKQLSTLVKAEERRRLARFIRGAKERRGCEVTFISRLRKPLKASLSISPLSDFGEAPRGYLLVGRIGSRRPPRVDDPSNGLAARILQGLAAPVFIVDCPSRAVVECNEAAISLLGFRREEIVGRRLFDYAPSLEERSRFKTLLKRADEAYSKAGFFKERIDVPRKAARPISCDCVSLPIFGPEGAIALKIFILFDRAAEDEREAAIVDLAEGARLLSFKLAELAQNRATGTRARRLSDLGLTKRQVEIACLIAQGASSKEIGFRLGITDSTVKNHAAQIFRKLGVKTRILFMRFLADEHILLC